MPLPLLSSTPPPFIQCDNCRACGKKVVSNRLFTSSKAKNCNHCGHVFCGDHCAHSAVRPRTASDPGIPGGMIEVSCCSFCIGFLQVTSSTQEQLHCLSTKELKRYLTAYSIPIPLGVNEKSQLEHVIIRSRVDGVLPPWHEAYYRNNSIPPPAPPSASSSSNNFFNNIFSSLDDAFSPDSPPRPQTSQRPSNGSSALPRQTPPSLNQARPAPQQARPNPAQPRPAPAQPPNRTHPQPTNGTRHHPSATSNGRAPPASSARPASPSPTQSANHRPTPPPRSPATSSAPRPYAPPSSTSRPTPASTTTTSASASLSRLPTLLELYETPEALSDLSIKTLKSILHRSHVRADNLLEKPELVARVSSLVEDEGRRVQREEEEARREEERVRDEREGREREERERAEKVGLERRMEELGIQEKKEGKEDVWKERRIEVERTGLCIICQDSDAILASVDCGHLALCSDCSELVMAGNRQCPLCRTVMRPGGLIRIFKT